MYYGGAHGPTVMRRYPGVAIGEPSRTREHGGMEVITPRRPEQHRSVAPLLSSTVVGTALVVGGLSMAYAAFATPLLAMVLPVGRPSAGQMAAGMAIWAIALVAPAAFILAGTNRLARLLVAVRGHLPRHSPTMTALAGLAEDVVVVTGLMLPDGRGVSELVMGPFGAVVLRELPPPQATRIQNGNWQLRTQRGWIPLDDPLARAVRDADRVRRWLAHDDADFVVKVYAAVVGTDPSVQRTPACAVLMPNQLAAWVVSLPSQRSLTPGRRQLMLDLARDAVG